jgi:hypothetical protein
MRSERRTVWKRFLLMQQNMRDDMTAHRPNGQRNSMLRKWFGPNRNTHWTIAGSVAVIMLGSYLVYSNRDSNPTGVPIYAIAGSPPPMSPAPLKSEK